MQRMYTSILNIIKIDHYLDMQTSKRLRHGKKYMYTFTFSGSTSLGVNLSSHKKSNSIVGKRFLSVKRFIRAMEINNEMVKNFESGQLAGLSKKSVVPLLAHAHRPHFWQKKSETFPALKKYVIWKFVKCYAYYVEWSIVWKKIKLKFIKMLQSKKTRAFCCYLVSMWCVQLWYKCS